MERKEPAEPNAARPEEPEVIDVDAAEEPDMGSLETKAEFDELVVWGHEATADASADPYVRSVEEWLTVAEQVKFYQCHEMGVLADISTDTFIRSSGCHHDRLKWETLLSINGAWWMAE